MNKKELEQFNKMFTGEKNALLFQMGLLDEIAIKDFISQIKANQRKDFKKLITKEIVSAQKEGQPTSRLTRLYKKL